MGLRKPRRRKEKHRERRARLACFGELVQVDTSIHNWLEARGEGPGGGVFRGDSLGANFQLSVLTRQVTRLAKRFFGVPDFHFYALADGIAALLARCGKGALSPRQPSPPLNPSDFSFDFEPPEK